MTYGSGMIWPLAAEYARRGWAVRRAGWDDLELFGDTGRALRPAIVQGLPVAGQEVHQRVVQDVDVDVQRRNQALGLYRRNAAVHLRPPI